MSNRFLWILIIIWFIWGWYLYYNLKYLPDIKAKELILKEEKIKLEEVKVIKNPELVKKEKIINIITNTDKINEIKENIKNYKTFNLDNGLKAYFIQSKSWLDFYYNYEKIWSFDLVYPEYLKVESILWNDQNLYFEVWNNKYYYNSSTKIIKNIEINIDVLYVKQWLINELIIVTSKWSFLYNVYNEKIEYFTYFNDFVNFDNGYIWIIKFDDIKRLNNLWFEWNNENLIVYYNPKTKEKIIILSILRDYNRLYINNNKVFLESNENELFELENI